MTSNYAIATSTGTLVPGTTDVGNHTDDGHTLINLPFDFRLYDQVFSTVSVDSNGNMGFILPDDDFTNVCLPDTDADYAIFPFYDDLCTGPCGNSPCALCGIFTSVSGSAPDRIFNIEWRADRFNTKVLTNFEVRLYENSPTARFDIIYGSTDSGGSATVGVQRGNGIGFTQFECNTSSLPDGLMLTFTLPACATPTPTPTECTLTFSDVPEGSTFYDSVQIYGVGLG
jgi:hypothetical protein